MRYVIAYLATTMSAWIVVAYCRTGSAMGFSPGIPIRSFALGFPFYSAALLLGCAIICVASYKLRDDARAGRILTATVTTLVFLSTLVGFFTAR